jgi:hypothetical protein
MRTVLIIILILILFGWYYCTQHLKTKEDFQVIQLELSQITDQTLMDKYPIYIEDRIVSIHDVVSSIFKYSYFTKKPIKITANVLHKCLSKYSLIHNTFGEEIRVLLTNTAETVDVIVEPDRLLVVPYKWSYTIDRNIEVIELYDLIHWLFHIV